MTPAQRNRARKARREESGLLQFSKSFRPQLMEAIIADRVHDSHTRVVVGESSLHAKAPTKAAPPHEPPRERLEGISLHTKTVGKSVDVTFAPPAAHFQSFFRDGTPTAPPKRAAQHK